MNNKTAFILASSSPRRKKILEGAQLLFQVVEPECSEDTDEKDPGKIVLELAQRKARDVFLKKGGVVLGCDTLVHLCGRIFGKPKDEREAKDMLRALSGQTHEVFSGVCVMDKEKAECCCEVTAVTFKELSDAQIDEYVKTGEYMGKAGAYAIQGLGALLVKKIDGDFYNVVGLPLAAAAELLKKFDVW